MQTIIDAKATVITFGRANYSTWDKTQCDFNHSDAIETILGAQGP